MTMRWALSGFGFFSVIFLSPLFALMAVVLLSLRYRAWEVLFIGLLMDLLWLPSGSFLYAVPISTILAATIVWLLEPLREQLLTD
jgi:hypothetical protein